MGKKRASSLHAEPVGAALNSAYVGRNLWRGVPRADRNAQAVFFTGGFIIACLTLATSFSASR